MLFAVQFAIVLLCILVGAQVGGIGLGVFGGLGLAVLTFGFGLQPTSPPIDVMLMIMAVVSAAAAMQAAGGLDYMIKVATRILRRNPKHITFIAPMVTYLFTVMAGTGHVAYSVLPVIAEVSRRNGIRPERPLSMAVIASQFAIIASPIAAAVVATVAYLEPQGIHLGDVLKVTVPSTILGIGLACVIVNKLGKELKDDPEYQRRLQDPEYAAEFAASSVAVDVDDKIVVGKNAKLSLGIFLAASLLVVVMGMMPSLRPAFADDSGAMKPLGMAHTIEIVMLSAGAVILWFCKPDNHAVTKGSVFHAGMRAVIAILGIAWLGDTLMHAHMAMLKDTVSGLVNAAPWTFALALFVFSVLVNSQGATVATLFPIAIKLGVPAPIIIGTFVAVNGYFFVPNYGPIIAAIDFDTTGTTKIGKFIFNHSFMIPGLLSLAFSLVFELALAKMLL